MGADDLVLRSFVLVVTMVCPMTLDKLCWLTSLIRVVITYSHPWFILLGVAICYATWAGMLKLWVLDVGLFYNNLLREIHGGTYPAYEQPIDYDPLSYGQVSKLCARYFVCLCAITTVLAPCCHHRDRTSLSSLQALLCPTQAGGRVDNDIPFVLLGRNRLPLHRHS